MEVTDTIQSICTADVVNRSLVLIICSVVVEHRQVQRHSKCIVVLVGETKTWEDVVVAATTAVLRLVRGAFPIVSEVAWIAALEYVLWFLVLDLVLVCPCRYEGSLVGVGYLL